MATNAIPPGTKNLTVNASEELVERVKALAEKMGTSVSQLCAKIISDSVNSGEVFRIIQQSLQEEEVKLAKRRALLLGSKSETTVKKEPAGRGVKKPQPAKR